MTAPPSNIELLTEKLRNFLRFVGELETKYSDPNIKKFRELIEGKPLTFAKAYITTEIVPYKDNMAEFVKKEFINHDIDIAHYEKDDLTKFKRYCLCFATLVIEMDGLK